MKLTPLQSNILRGIISEKLNDEMEIMMENMMDNYFRDGLIDELSDEDFTEDEKDEILEMWDDTDKEGGIDNKVWMDFMEEVVQSMMKKFEE